MAFERVKISRASHCNGQFKIRRPLCCFASQTKRVLSRLPWRNTRYRRAIHRRVSAPDRPARIRRSDLPQYDRLRRGDNTGSWTMAAPSGAACPRQAARSFAMRCEIVCVRGALNDGKLNQFGMRHSGIIRPCHRSSTTWRISARVADRHQAAAAVDVDAGGPQSVAVAGTRAPPSAAPSAW